MAERSKGQGRDRHSHRRPTTARLALLCILLVAFALRVFRLDFQELRGDEAFGYFFSLRPFANIVEATLDLGEPHPVASYFVQHLWLDWVGHSEFALRYAGVIWSVLAVAILCRLARRLALPVGMAGVAALLFALSPYAVWHSQDARMYNLSLCLTLASTWLMIEALQRGRRRVWLAYLLVTWLALHTHYFALFIVVAQNLFVLGRAVATRRMALVAAGWLQVQVVLGFFYLPWALAALETLTGYGGNGSSPGFVEMAWRTLGAFAAGDGLPAGQRQGLGWLSAGLALLGIVHLWQRGAPGRRALALLLLLWLTPVLATWFNALDRPVFDERYLIAAVPGFYLLLGAGIFPQRRWQMPIAALLALVLIAGMLLSLRNIYTDPFYSKTRGWRELAAAFERFSAGLPVEEVRLVQNFPDPTIWYYYRGPVEHLVLPPQPNDAAGAAETVADLAEAGVRRLILPVQPAAWWDGGNIAPQALAQRFTQVAEEPVGVWPVQIYTRAPDEAAPVGVSFANGLVLVAAAVAPGQLVGGGLLAVHLDWDADAAQLDGNEIVFLHLIDGDGQIVAQHDRPLALSAKPDQMSSYGILLPKALSDPSYRLLVGLYRPDQEGAPRILTEHGGDAVELAIWP